MFSRSTPPSVTCTFSTTCGLKSLFLQIFFQTGFIDSSDCVRLLVPDYCCNVNTSPYLSQILNYDSGRTPGCLVTTVLSTLSLLLSLTPDAPLVDLLARETPTPNDKVIKPWLDFLHDIVVSSPSEHLRQTATSRLNVLVAYGLVSLQSPTKLGEDSNTSVAGFVMKYLFTVLKVSLLPTLPPSYTGGRVYGLNFIPKFCFLGKRIESSPSFSQVCRCSY